MAHHEPFKSLGPIDWSDVSREGTEHFLKTTFAQAQVVINGIPQRPAPARPSQVGRARSHTDSSVFFDPSSTSQHTRTGRDHADTTASADASAATAAANAAQLQKEWKEVKVQPRDNPLGITVYKLSGKDGRGAWFARRSLHEGIPFDKFKLGLEREFGETLKNTKGPGTGNVRGIGAERRSEHTVCHGLGKAEVWLLSAQFPGPTTPRDFVTLLLTGSASADDDDGKKKRNEPRQFMVVSRPCNHLDCPLRQGFIRGNYESVEIIREVPVEKPLRRVRSSADIKQLGGSKGVGQEAMLRSAHLAAASPGGTNDSRVNASRRALARSLSELPVREPVREPEAEDDSGAGAETVGVKTEMAIEWLMVTRSDPGGSVPRFMVEKGTPGGIVSDAGRFVTWLESKSARDFEGSPDDDFKEAAVKSEILEASTPTQDALVSKIPASNPQTTHAPAPDQVAPSGFYNMVAGAFGVASSAVAARLPGFSFSASEADTDPEDSGSESGSEHSFASAQEPEEEELPLAEKVLSGDKSTRGEIASMHSGISDESTSKASMTQHEKQLQKLRDRRTKLEEKINRQQEQKMQSKHNQSGDALAKLKEKHEKEIARQEENHRREVKKLEEKRLKEEKKAEEKKRKQAEREGRENMGMQLERARVDRDMALKQVDILKQQVGELQAQNTKLVAKLGKLGALGTPDELIGDGTGGIEGGKLSQTSSLSK